MKLLESATPLSEKVQYLIQGIVQSDPLQSGLTTQEQSVWQNVAETIHRWAQDPDQVEDEDEDVHAPEPSVARLAFEVAVVMRTRDLTPPSRVVPNGDGGLVFRWRTGENTWTLEFESDGSMESYLMRNGKLVRRHSLHEGAGV